MAYYCMDLVAIVAVTEWSWWKQVLAHVLLLMPHGLLALVISPAVMKYESLLSCVVRRVDDLVATVVDQMERTNRVVESLRSKVVDAHRQEVEDEQTPGVRDTRERRRSRMQSDQPEDREYRKRELSQHLKRTASGSGLGVSISDTSSSSIITSGGTSFSEEELADAVRWLFKKISRGDQEVSLRRLRVGLHKISSYFTEKDWSLLSRLLDRDRSKEVSEQDLLLVLAGQGSLVDWQKATQSNLLKGQDNPDSDPNVDIDTIGAMAPELVQGASGSLASFLANSNPARAQAGARMWGWMYEDVEDIQTAANLRRSNSTPAVSPVRTRSHTMPARSHHAEPTIREEGGGMSVAFAPEPELESRSGEGDKQVKVTLAPEAIEEEEEESEGTPGARKSDYQTPPTATTPPAPSPASAGKNDGANGAGPAAP